MKKFIIYLICIIITFFISVYIGFKFDMQSEGDKVEKNIGTTEERQNTKMNEIEQAVSEDEVTKEHYVLREVGRYIKVYSIDDNEKEELYLSTDIATEYLPETDKNSLKKGIHVYNKKDLNEILQDFE